MEKQLNEISDKITELIKKDIRKKKLIDTGVMIKSIVTIPISEVQFKIIGCDYFEIVSQKYDIVRDVLESKEFLEFYAEKMAELVTK